MGGKSKGWKRAALGGATFGLSEVARGIKNDRTPGDRANANQWMSDAYRSIESYLLPYDQLVATGRVQPGQNEYGLRGNESRFSRALSAYEDQLAASNPIFGQYRDTVQSGLAGIENGGIPDDMRRSITEGLRDTQARRGILDSNVGAVEEVVRLMGGSEAVRAQRLSQAQDYFSGVTAGGINALMPSLGLNLGLQQNAYGSNQQRSQNAYGNLMQQWGLGLDTAGGLIGIGAGFAKPGGATGGTSYATQKYGG